MKQPLNVIEAVTHTNPFPYYRSLRERCPLFFDETLNLWVATSYAVISEALTNPTLRVRPITEPIPTSLLGSAAGEVFALLVRMNDGEFHSKHKPSIIQTLKNLDLAQVAKATEDAIRDLQPRLDANSLITELPVQTMARLLNVTDDALPDTVRWVTQFTGGISASATKQAISLASDAARALLDQGQALGLTPVEAANRIALMQQSLDATAGLLGNTALMLQSDILPNCSLDSMRSFVIEAERYCTPVQNTRRYTSETLLLGNQVIESGQGIILVLASANRDESLNSQPDQFNSNRFHSRSLGFGFGSHTCPGMDFAIEIAASCMFSMRASGLFDNYFNHTGAFRSLPNARIPIFINSKEGL